MDPEFKLKTFVAYLTFTPIMGALLFVSAGTFNYWQGWLYLVVFTSVSLLSTLSLMKNDPELLKRRMKSGPTAEKRGPQKIIMWVLTFAFVAIFIVSGLDQRMAWSHAPAVVPCVGEALIVLSFVVFEIVFRANTFASATIEIADGQKVISTGPYGLVRHPMYSGAIIFLLGIPLALGSLWAVLICVPLLPVLVWRIIDEEKLLHKQVDGYTEYCAKVKYRLLPGIF